MECKIIVKNLIELIIISSAIIISLVNFFQMCKIKKRYKIFKSGTNDANLEMLLQKYIQLVNEINNKNVDIENKISIIQHDMLNNIQKMGLKKYNAFKDMSNNLSFSLALLDGNDNGIILTQLYLRNSANVYIRNIKNGNSDVSLSDEEKEAIKIAQNI